MKTEPISFYCLCGAQWAGDFAGNPEVMRKLWGVLHPAETIDTFGNRHGPTDPETCRRNRGKAEHAGRTKNSINP